MPKRPYLPPHFLTRSGAVELLEYLIHDDGWVRFKKLNEVYDEAVKSPKTNPILRVLSIPGRSDVLEEIVNCSGRDGRMRFSEIYEKPSVRRVVMSTGALSVCLNDLLGVKLVVREVEGAGRSYYRSVEYAGEVLKTYRDLENLLGV